MEWLIDLVSGGAVGGILGLAGKFIEGRQRLKELELTAKEKANDRSHELSMVQFEAQSAMELANLELLGKENEADHKALQSSIDAEAKGATWSTGWMGKVKGAWGSFIGFLLGIVDVVRGLMRPVLAVALTWFVIWFVQEGMTRLPQELTDKFFEENIKTAIRVALSLWGIAVGWYFASRPQDRSHR